MAVHLSLVLQSQVQGKPPETVVCKSGKSYIIEENYISKVKQCYSVKYLK